MMDKFKKSIKRAFISIMLLAAVGIFTPALCQEISTDQAISDDAQMKTIAFSGLAFLTGDFCSSTFFPPGKVSDFFGFQYMRDIAPNGFGHNTEYAGKVSDFVLDILTGDQVQSLISLANAQAALVEAYGLQRFALIKAFQRLLDNDMPDGAEGLDPRAVLDYTADLYEIDAWISYDRARVFGSIIASMTEDQKTALTALHDQLDTLFLAAGSSGTIQWPAVERADLSGITVTEGHVLVSTYATQLYSWYLGGVAADIYFCPERHGTYFGSFYMKDIPPFTADTAVSIDTNVTADMGQAFLNILDSSQAELITGIIDLQKIHLLSIVSVRQSIAKQLRKFMGGKTPSQEDVTALVRKYGKYEGKMICQYATRFARVGHSLTSEQAAKVSDLRTGYYSRFAAYLADPNAYECTGAWLYSSKIDMPVIGDTDYFFLSLSEN